MVSPRATAVVALLATLPGCMSAGSGSGDAGTPPDGGDAPLADLAWRAHAAAPAARAEGAIAVLDGRAFVVGGLVADAEGALVASQRVDVFDPATGAWTRGPDYPVPVHHAAAVAFDGAILVFGGYLGDHAHPTDLAHRLRPGGAWERISNLPVARAAHAAAVVDERIWLVGGTGVGAKAPDGRPEALANPARVDVYEPAAATWSEGPRLPTPRDHLGLVARDGKLHAIGGRFLSNVDHSDAHEAFDSATGRWAALARLPDPRSGFAFGLYRDRLVVASGEAARAAEARASAYDFDRDAWDPLPDLPTPRYGLAAGVASNDRFYVLLGGLKSADYAPTAVVESLGPREAGA